MEEKAEKSAKEYDFIQLFPCSEAKYWAYGGASVKKRLVALSSLRLEARNHQRQGQSANGGGSSNDASFETSQWVLPVVKNYCCNITLCTFANCNNTRVQNGYCVVITTISDVPDRSNTVAPRHLLQYVSASV
jgi:hypothetical protein